MEWKQFKRYWNTVDVNKSYSFLLSLWSNSTSLRQPLAFLLSIAVKTKCCGLNAPLLWWINTVCIVITFYTIGKMISDVKYVHVLHTNTIAVRFVFKLGTVNQFYSPINCMLLCVITIHWVDINDNSSDPALVIQYVAFHRDQSNYIWLRLNLFYLPLIINFIRADFFLSPSKLVS